MYKCKHFQIHELVPKSVFKKRGEKAWQLLDDRLLITLDRLREKFGSMTVNNYYWQGDREWSGLRTSDSPYYSPFSQHSFGRAADCLFQDHDAESIRQQILAAPRQHEFELIGSIELDVSWLHFDVRNCDRIMTYKP
ncbi:hypothetical protein DU002_13240 [Corallincola holothuriorum]|uniref:Peptidase M15A C-terminal domain-containing protein n=1 Tax=Corallincola holothuriorum TaxID=2282215 RepID=A0A368NGK3_9GAMM|nr:hypothetical protein [Corallincola holothuriorum]RCU48754.1 hypothetical protein DU002_13240 [Corallincola holothuriorum]